MDRIPGNKQGSPTSGVEETTCDQRSPWELAKVVVTPSQSKLKDNAEEASSRFQNTSKTSDSEQDAPNTEMFGEEELSKVAHHKNTQSWPAMSVGNVSANQSKNTKVISNRVHKPSFQGKVSNMKVPHSLFQRASMTTTESKDFVGMSEQIDSNTLDHQHSCQTEGGEVSKYSGQKVKEEETSQSNPQESIPVTKKVPVFGKARIKSKKSCVGSGTPVKRTIDVSSKCHDSKYAKLTDGFQKKTQNRIVKTCSFEKPVHGDQSSKENDMSKSSTKHEGDLLPEKDNFQADRSAVVDAPGNLDAVPVSKTEILQTKVQESVVAPPSEEHKEESNSYAPRNPHFTIGIQTPEQINKNLEIKKDACREIGSVDYLMKENLDNDMVKKATSESFSAPQTEDNKKASNYIKSKEDINPSRMTDEQWKNLFDSVINMTFEDRVDFEIKQVDSDLEKQKLESDTRPKEKKRKRQRAVTECKKMMLEEKYEDNVHESAKDCRKEQPMNELLSGDSLIDLSESSFDENLVINNLLENFPDLDTSEESSLSLSPNDDGSSNRVGEKGKRKSSKSRNSSADAKSGSKISPQTSMRKTQVLEIIENLDEDVWVQCDSCNKWRKCTRNDDPSTLPKSWSCIMNKDLLHNRCSIPEEDWGDTDEFYLYSRFILGSVVWAQVPCTPWWPAIVDIDPDYRCFLWVKPKKSHPEYVHVTFFGDPVTRAWVTLNRITPFKMRHTARTFASRDCRGSVIDPALEAAVNEAQSALMMDIHSRRRNYNFASRFKGKIVFKEDFNARNETKNKMHQKRRLKNTSTEDSLSKECKSADNMNKKMKRDVGARDPTYCIEKEYKLVIDEDEYMKRKYKNQSENVDLEEYISSNENENIKGDSIKTENQVSAHKANEKSRNLERKGVDSEMDHKFGKNENLKEYGHEGNEEEVIGCENEERNADVQGHLERSMEKKEAGHVCGEDFKEYQVKVIEPDDYEGDDEVSAECVTEDEEHDQSGEQEPGRTEDDEHYESGEQEADGTEDDGNCESGEQEAGGTGGDEHYDSGEQEADGTEDDGNCESGEQEAGGTEGDEHYESGEQEAGGTEGDGHYESGEQEAGGTEGDEHYESGEQEADGTEDDGNCESGEQEAGGTEGDEHYESGEQEAGGTEGDEHYESGEQEADGTEGDEHYESGEQEAGGTEGDEHYESGEQEAGGTEGDEHYESGEQEAGGTEGDEHYESGEQEADGTEDDGNCESGEQEAGGTEGDGHYESGKEEACRICGIEDGEADESREQDED
ncbi:uncharacterized protein LOC122258800 isoform X3 [Penaeus japonicus]|nr:uncharacterized protein LOC122258800 isoform X3 [Penaeus japonicus]